jgi:hypothetical protein
MKRLLHLPFDFDPACGMEEEILLERDSLVSKPPRRAQHDVDRKHGVAKLFIAMVGHSNPRN